MPATELEGNPFAPFFLEIRAIVKDEVQKALIAKVTMQEDHLVTAEEAAKILSVSPDWLYRRSKRLPFTRKIHHKMIRFSFQGIQKYITDAKQF